jgi:hypothetical protein
MKKKVFENLKNSAENFSNKLLNKLFGNEDGEEESQQDYQSNIHPNDINIVKFKAANDDHSSIKNAFSFMEIVIVLSLFLLVYLICFIVKYFDFRNNNGISVTISGTASGEMLVSVDENFREVVAGIPVNVDGKQVTLSARSSISDGVKPLYFMFRGKGAVDFIAFELK